MKKYLATIWGRLLDWGPGFFLWGTYVRDEHHRGQQAREREAVADLLHEGAGGAERRRRDERPAVDVHDDANGDVQRRHDRLAHDERLGVVVRVAHLRDDVEEGGGTGVGENER
jgi:hypothetical protein